MKALWMLAAALLACMSLTRITTAQASLGDSESSVDRDRAILNGSKKVISQNSYSVHVISSAESTVREYVSSNGTVFAVTWEGLSEPDLSQLFGSYYQEYRGAAEKGPKGSRRALKKLESTNIVVEKFGHMGDIRGRAYIRSLVPNGVAIDSLQ